MPNTKSKKRTKSRVISVKKVSSSDEKGNQKALSPKIITGKSRTYKVWNEVTAPKSRIIYSIQTILDTSRKPMKNK